MKRVAITGGLASGKTSVAHFFAKCGAVVVSADAVVHKLLSPHTPLGQQIILLLGPDIVAQGQFDRSKIAHKVFSDRELLDKYEMLLHPVIRKEIAAALDEAEKASSAPLLFAEVPLLYEAGMAEDYDYVIAVQAPEAACITRFTERTGYGADEFHRRSSRLLPAKEIAERADLVINNTGSLEELENTVASSYYRLCDILNPSH